jgi:hypothetical protein
MSQQDQHASELNHAEKVIGVALPSAALAFNDCALHRIESLLAALSIRARAAGCGKLSIPEP